MHSCFLLRQLQRVPDQFPASTLVLVQSALHTETREIFLIYTPDHVTLLAILWLSITLRKKSQFLNIIRTTILFGCGHTPLSQSIYIWITKLNDLAKVTQLANAGRLTSEIPEFHAQPSLHFSIPPTLSY